MLNNFRYYNSSFLASLDSGPSHILICKYSDTNTLKILFKFSIVSISRAFLSSEGLCHTSGNGEGIICNMGTPEKCFYS